MLSSIVHNQFVDDCEDNFARLDIVEKDIKEQRNKVAELTTKVVNLTKQDTKQSKKITEQSKKITEQGMKITEQGMKITEQSKKITELDLKLAKQQKEILLDQEKVALGEIAFTSQKFIKYLANSKLKTFGEMAFDSDDLNCTAVNGFMQDLADKCTMNVDIDNHLINTVLNKLKQPRLHFAHKASEDLQKKSVLENLINKEFEDGKEKEVALGLLSLLCEKVADSEVQVLEQSKKQIEEWWRIRNASKRSKVFSKKS
jgi:hypothetical protein